MIKPRSSSSMPQSLHIIHLVSWNFSELGVPWYVEDILPNKDLEIISESKEAGVYIVASKNGKQVFVMGHSEYDPRTLQEEYQRDLEKGFDIKVPYNYFPDDNPENEPRVRWKSHANLLYSNWLNYYVYQATPFNLDEIS